MDGKRAEQVFMNKLANKTLRNEYMDKAQDIGGNAINLVKEFFDTPLGIVDSIDYQMYEWTLTDLDRALDEMDENKRPTDEIEIKTVDNRDSYTKALARCAIHDHPKHALLYERMKNCDDETLKKLAARKIEIDNVLLAHYHEFWWDGIL